MPDVDRVHDGRLARLLGPVVKAIDAHGGNIYRVAREQHRRPAELCDFSASINPLGPPGRVLRALRNGLWALGHYPDPDAYEVRQALGKQFGLPPDRFLIGNGSAELISLLPGSLKIRRALVVGPTFSEYESAIRRADAVCTYSFAARREDYRPPIERVMMRLEKQRDIEAVFLCNPNSPTGQVVAKRDLLLLTGVLNRYNRWLVIDEAFCEFAPDHSLLDALSRCPRLVILRSCTKFFSIPGLRLGYLVGHPAVLEQVRQHQVPWSVNALAQIAALAALEETGYRDASLRYVEQERRRFVSALRAIPGLHVFPSAANFLLIELPSAMSAGRLSDRLRKSGILVRDCSHVPGLNKRTIRIAVKRRRDNMRLCRALKEILHG
ncbi:MAG TPA: threonine-phosphate decarboxylase CobD [Nitrospiraceae bacterium]|nr:threonine-phosphate decarboxylase CobD [Nitrospiraceae bacterium]